MGQEFSAFAHQVGAAPEQVAGGAHLSRRDRGFWEHATAQQGSNLVRINLVVFSLAAMDGLHGEGMSQDEGNVLLRTEIGEPIPGEDTFDGHDEPLTIGGNGLEERFRSGLHVAVQQDFAIVAQDADGPWNGHANRCRSKMGADWCKIALRSPPW